MLDAYYWRKQMSTGFELEETRTVTTAELDELVVALKAARADYDQASSVATEKHSVVKELEFKLIDLLTVAGKNSYEVDKVARVSVVSKTQVTVPKTTEQKEMLFKWIEERYGKEGMLAYQTINYQSLNSLYNKEMEAALEAGETLNIPGLELPQLVRTLSVRSK